jgi:hypothetical protein
MSHRVPLTLSMLLATVVGVAGPALAAPQGGHQTFVIAQNAGAIEAMNRWTAAMDAADKSMADKAPVDEMLKALEAPDLYHESKMLELRSHPAYQATLQRQLALRLKKAKLYANIGFLYAKTGAERRDGSLFTQQGGAFARMQQATDTLASYARYKGEADAGYREMTAYVGKLKAQVDNVAGQLNVKPGMTAGGGSAAPDSATPIDNGTRTYFVQWWDKLNNVEQLLATNDKRAEQALASAREHQKGWNGWLVKHSEYEKAMARQNAFAARMATAKANGFVTEALELAKKGVADKNTNYFGPTAGPAQRLDWARKELDAYIKLNGEADPQVAPLKARIAAAAKDIDAMGLKLKQAELASRKMPVDVYGGGDKASLKAQILAFWKAKYPQDKILGIRFFETNWKRETAWNANATNLYKTDYSWLPVKLIVQTSPDIATLYPVFANKRHLEGNKIVIAGDHGGGGYVVSEMLMKNVRF